jgi:hypothetical protein
MSQCENTIVIMMACLCGGMFDFVFAMFCVCGAFSNGDGFNFSFWNEGAISGFCCKYKKVEVGS